MKSLILYTANRIPSVSVNGMLQKSDNLRDGTSPNTKPLPGCDEATRLDPLPPFTEDPGHQRGIGCTQFGSNSRITSGHIEDFRPSVSYIVQEPNRDNAQLTCDHPNVSTSRNGQRFFSPEVLQDTKIDGIQSSQDQPTINATKYIRTRDLPAIKSN